MLVDTGPWRAAEARNMTGRSGLPVDGKPRDSAAALTVPAFSGSYPDWCEEGFSICEGYLIEAQSFFLHGKLDGFLAMAAAQFDAELEDETLAHANALLVDVTFCRMSGEIESVESDHGDAGLNWLNVVNLYRAMETTKGDMRMPRLHPAFDKVLRKALVLS